MELPESGRVKSGNILSWYDGTMARPVGRWGIGRAGITRSKVEGGRSGWETGGRCNVYIGRVIIAVSRRKGRKLLGTGTLSVPPRVEIPLAWDVLAGESAF